ncbi:unnamed protein product, partial [Mycena citricolor]
RERVRRCGEGDALQHLRGDHFQGHAFAGSVCGWGEGGGEGDVYRRVRAGLCTCDWACLRRFDMRCLLGPDVSRGHVPAFRAGFRAISMDLSWCWGQVRSCVPIRGDDCLFKLEARRKATTSQSRVDSPSISQ